MLVYDKMVEKVETISYEISKEDLKKLGIEGEIVQSCATEPKTERYDSLRGGNRCSDYQKIVVQIKKRTGL